MGLFKPKEIECTCLKCGRVWFTTKNEIQEAKQLKFNIKKAKFDNAWGFHNAGTYRNNAAKIALMQSAYVDPLRCPDCGTSEVEYE